MIYLLLVFLFTLIVLDFVKNKKLHTPGIIFNLVFLVSLFLYNFYLSDIQQTLTSKTIWIITSFIVAFNIPIFRNYYKKNIMIVNLKKRIPFRISETREMIVYYIAFTVFVVEMIYSKGCPLAWKLIGNGKTYFDFGIPSVNGMFYGLVILMGSYSLFKKGCIYKYLYLSFGILMISRQMLISIFVQAVVLYLLTHKLSKKLVIIIITGLVLGVLSFSLFGNIRTGEGEFLKVAQFKETFKWIPTAFKWIYAYICFSFSNLNNLFNMTNGCVNYGASNFNELMPSVINLKMPINRDFDILICDNFNVSTFAPSLYVDFGVIGLCLFCLIIGIIAKFFYTRANSNEMVSKLVYMVIAHNMIFLFFINMFTYLPIMFEFFLIPFIFVIDYKDLKNKILKRKGEK